MILYCKLNGVWTAIPAVTGESAYQIALKNGFIGTEEEWLASLKGDPGSLENLTKADVENVLIGDITSHNHGTEIAAALTNYVVNVVGKGLSTNDLTDALLAKLNGLSNYDDTTISDALTTLQNQLNTLVSGDASTAIESFNEITAFLANVTDSETLESILAGLNTTISDSLATAKQYADNGISAHNTSNTAHQDIRNSIPTIPATQSANGLMSSTDKTKLDGVETEANKYVLPTASASVLGGIKVGSGLSMTDEVLSVTNTGGNLAYEKISSLTSILSIANGTAYDITLTEDWDSTAVYVFRFVTYETSPYSYQNILVFGNQTTDPIGFISYVTGFYYKEFLISNINGNVITLLGNSSSSPKLENIYKLK